MHVDIVTLSRIFFGLTIMFHYIFPPLTIGLGLFWTKIFAASFAVGVATGIVMEFEFGTNWATYHLGKQANGFVRAEITDFWQLVFNSYLMVACDNSAFNVDVYNGASSISYWVFRGKTQLNKHSY